MSNQFKLLELNPQLALKDGFYQDVGELFRDSALSNYIQIAVADVFEAVNDKSLFSIEIEEAASTADLRSALSLSQFRFLQMFDFGKVDKSLDLCEDFGGVAHFLADHVGSIESIKVDPDLARLSTIRCANKHNVCHISEDLEKLTLPCDHYDLIVIGQLEKFKLSETEQHALFSKLQKALSSHGVLLVSALNSDRLRKWFDASSSTGDTAMPYADLYTPQSQRRYSTEQSRKQLRDSLLAANFTAIDIHANFSTGNDCKALFSEDYLTSCVNGLNHFYRLGSISNPDINEYLLYKKMLADKHNLTDFANRFLLLAGSSKGHIRRLYDNDFSHFPGQGRKPQWRAITSRQRSAPNVEKLAAYSSSEKSALISQNLDPKPFHKGSLLIDDWLQAILDSDHAKFAALVQEYTDWLLELEKTPNFDKIAYDLLPLISS